MVWNTIHASTSKVEQNAIVQNRYNDINPCLE